MLTPISVNLRKIPDLRRECSTFKKKGANIKLDAFFRATLLKCTMNGEACIVTKPQSFPCFSPLYCSIEFMDSTMLKPCPRMQWAGDGPGRVALTLVAPSHSLYFPIAFSSPPHPPAAFCASSHLASETPPHVSHHYPSSTFFLTIQAGKSLSLG